MKRANSTEYGLHGAVYTSDAERGYGLARRTRSGSVAVNRKPCGGFKQSGIGLDPYFELKTIYFA